MGAARPARPPRPNRFGTLNEFVRDRLAALTSDTGSGNAGLVWFVLFALASGKDGTVRGASNTRLERLTGLTRKTVRAAVRALVKAGLVKVVKNGRVPTYEVAHIREGVGSGYPVTG